ncbi:MAG: hypothetical protein ACYTDT_10320 [Planctomycetota bacterium]|jgi:hypothetical protein
MPLSISNSDPAGREDLAAALRVPDFPVAKTALLLIGVAALGLLAWEGFLAMHGETPPATMDDRNSWMNNWRKLGDDVQLVFAGSSRFQEGISPLDVAAGYGCDESQVLNMGSASGGGETLLREFADSDKFDGWLVVEVLPTDFFGREPPLALESYLEQTTRPGVYVDAELFAHEGWRKAARVSDASNSPLRTLQRLLSGGEKSIGPKLTLHQNRWLEAEVDSISEGHRDGLAVVESEYFARSGVPMSATELRALLDLLQVRVESLAESKVEVVFIRMPSDRAVWEVESSRYPRAEYWDELAGRFPDRSIHFKDDAVLKDLETFDGSHLGAKEARTASKRIGKLLRKLEGN